MLLQLLPCVLPLRLERIGHLQLHAQQGLCRAAISSIYAALGCCTHMPSLHELGVALYVSIDTGAH